MQENPLRLRTRRRSWLYALVAVALGGGVLLLRVRDRPHYAEVKQLASKLGDGNHWFYQEPQATAFRSLARLGPNAYPALAKLVWSHYTKLDRLYALSRGKLPASAARLLPRREPKDELS